MFLNACSSKELEKIARDIYRAFASQEAATMAMHRSSEKATAFFSKYIHPLDYEFPIPADRGPGLNPEGDDGIAIETASVHDPSPALPTQGETSMDHTMGRRSGDEALYNNILFLRDGLDYLEFQESIHEGDPGRTFEVIKVSHP